MQKNCATQPQSNRKGLLQPKTRHQEKNTDAIFVKEAKIENAVPSLSIFASYLH